ncbi:MAG: serine hydrolase domain-containing protein [Planctomycetaceae bacterium]
MSALDARLQALVDADVVAWPTMPARLLRVWAPGLGVDVEVAAGVADLATGAPVVPGSRFRIASVTKPFVAAATLRLVEDDRLSLDDTVAALLPGTYDELLRSGGYDTGAITLRHLLTHTSGIYDFASDAYDPSIPDGFSAQVAKDPSRRWAREEQIAFAVSHGRPYGPPGTVFAYSDTGACLVGEVLERVTGQTMGAAIRELVGYERLGLAHTWQETVEPEPADLPPLSHQYEGATDVADFDASVDLWGGGGLMSTCGDLARFFRALLRGEVFREPATLATMTTTLVGVPSAAGTPVDDDPSTAAMFLFRYGLGGHTWWGHGGYWGTTAWTCPSRDVTIVAGHQRSDMPKDFDRNAIALAAFAALSGA